MPARSIQQNKTKPFTDSRQHHCPLHLSRVCVSSHAHSFSPFSMLTPPANLQSNVSTLLRRLLSLHWFGIPKNGFLCCNNDETTLLNPFSDLLLTRNRLMLFWHICAEMLRPMLTFGPLSHRLSHINKCFKRERATKREREKTCGTVINVWTIKMRFYLFPQKIANILIQFENGIEIPKKNVV